MTPPTLTITIKRIGDAKPPRIRSRPYPRRQQR